uniref:SFRICE_024243 n=1 Tax=Spodoptera frugiperda TaxID=7108 RepID=A0A2H1WG93_SPOFR
MYRHAFYPRRGRQRCTMWHVMPLYKVHSLFTICVISPMLKGFTLFDTVFNVTEFFFNGEQSSYAFSRLGLGD